MKETLAEAAARPTLQINIYRRCDTPALTEVLYYNMKNNLKLKYHRLKKFKEQKIYFVQMT